MQLIYEFNNIFKRKKLKLKLTPYEIIPIGPEGCLVEMVKDATSIDGLKKVRIYVFGWFGLCKGFEVNLRPFLNFRDFEF
jgi:hypothetical protein